MTTAASTTRPAAPVGSHMATSEPAPSATAPVRAEAPDWPTIVAEPSIDITVAERPCGERSAARLYSVTTVGPMPMPATAIAPIRPHSPPARPKAIIAASISEENTSQRAARRNRSGNSEIDSARIVEPMPITPYTRPAESESPVPARKAVSEVSTVPKNRPTPSAPATITSTRGVRSSDAGACTVGASVLGALSAPVGCSANAVTNTRVSTAAPIMGAAGLIVVASRPTTTGPNTNAVSSAADS